jgi:hypothetical protein
MRNWLMQGFSSRRKLCMSVAGIMAGHFQKVFTEPKALYEVVRYL